MEKRRIHFNVPQIRSKLIGAPTEVAIWGRGTGKTEGLAAPKLESCYLHTMPRGTGVIVGLSYNQLLTRTLPGLKYGWEKLGYKLGEHYLIGKRPTDKWKKKWKWPGPFYEPELYEHYITWWNGAGIHLVSQDRPGSSNGISIDWIYGDEAKFLKVDRLRQELFPANRGIKPSFAGNPYHHGITFTTDMPIGTSGWWLFEYEEHMDKERVAQILSIQKLIYRISKAKKNAKQKVAAELFLDELNNELTLLRKGLIYYHEASTLWNIHALGADWFVNELINQAEFLFDTQLLNIRPLKLEDGFYPDLNEEKHGYVSFDNSYLDSLGFDFEKITKLDCRRDADLQDDKPLHISLDYNRRLWPLVVGQQARLPVNTLKIINAIYVEYPLKLTDVLQKFVEYYEPHKRKVVYYWYDHTAIAEQRETRLCDDVISYLRKHGWVVIEKYIGRASGHEHRYRMYGDLLQENGKYNMILRFNRDNSEQLLTSMFRTQAERRKDGFGKDKKSEVDPLFPAKDAPHFSEALDTMIDGILQSQTNYHNDQVELGADSI
jgi:hypothetical protein